jgi:hypothetical protein
MSERSVSASTILSDRTRRSAAANEKGSGDEKQHRIDGQPVDEITYAMRVQSAVNECVRRRVEVGLDIVGDGEMGKPSFISMRPRG